MMFSVVLFDMVKKFINGIKGKKMVNKINDDLYKIFARYIYKIFVMHHINGNHH